MIYALAAIVSLAFLLSKNRRLEVVGVLMLGVTGLLFFSLS